MSKISFDPYEHQAQLGIEYPTDPNAKKLYAVGCYTAEDWDYIHEVLLKDGTLEDNIPKESIECADIKDHSATRAVYLLTDAEANELRNHPKVEYVHENFESYPCKYKPNPEEVKAGFLPKTNRYNSAQRNYRNWFDNSQLPSPATSAEFLRSGYQLLRCVDKTDPWWNGLSTGSNQIFTDRVLQQYGDGTDVDVIVGDEGCWFGHVEFQTNATSGGPQNYKTYNPLYAGFSTLAPSATTGSCDLLDLALDAPYWLDPAWFEADVANRLTLRWDGTTVPTETAAKNWWSSNTSRSASFSTFGTLTVFSGYTRSACTGNSSGRPTIDTTHGTQCTASAVGRTQGWAYNANKWFINVYGTNGVDFEPYFNMMKIFHQAKGINPRYGNKNPTISSNSWGFRSSSFRTTAFYFYRQGTSGGTGVSYTSSTIPAFMTNIGILGDLGRMAGEQLPNSMLTAGKEMIDAGVIFICAAGNASQKQVNSSHADYNNYWSTLGSNASLSQSIHQEFGIDTLNTVNRRGYPEQIGSYVDGSGNVIYPVIAVGALDDAFGSDGLERKVNYSNMGNEVDCYAPADGILTATNATSGSSRPDTYSVGSQIFDDGVTGIAITNSELSGTSSFRLLINTARRVTTSSGIGTVTEIPLNLLGSTGLSGVSTVPTTGSNDDGYWKLDLPFNIEFAGITTNAIYPGTNSYVTINGGTTAYSSISFSNPPLPKIMISTNDNSCQRIYYGAVGTAPNRTYRIRWEGHNGFRYGVLGSPTMLYEITFYEATPSQFDVHVGVNGRVATPVGAAAFDAKFSGTSAACPVTTGFLATKLQYNRTWTWQDVRNWLKTTVGTANTTTPQFFTGVESNGATDSNWSNLNSLEGGSPIVIWDALTGNEPFRGTLTMKNVSIKNFKTK